MIQVNVKKLTKAKTADVINLLKADHLAETAIPRSNCRTRKPSVAVFHTITTFLLSINGMGSPSLQRTPSIVVTYSRMRLRHSNISTVQNRSVHQIHARL